MKWRVLFFLSVLILLIIFLIRNEIPVVSESLNKTTTANSLLSQIKKVLKSDSQQTQDLIKHSSEDILPIVGWLKDQAQKMDTEVFDSVSEEVQLRNKATRLSTQEVLFLKETALNTKASANERILSTFMLCLSSSQSLRALQELAVSKLSVKEIPSPHSLDETQVMHEKALLRMAIDELFRRALLNPSYKDELANQIEKIQVPELKSYAQNRFKQQFK